MVFYLHTKDRIKVITNIKQVSDNNTDALHSYVVIVLPQVATDVLPFRRFRSSNKESTLCRSSNFNVSIFTKKDSLIEIANVENIRFILGTDGFAKR